MLFNSYAFIFGFLPLALAGYFALNRLKNQSAKVFLILASLCFYCYMSVSFLPVILTSLLANFAFTSTISEMKDAGRKRLIFIASLVFNIGLLAFYKYSNFFITEYKIILPLGLSFYTLQQVAHLVDVYEGMTGKKRFIDYALCVTFFPSLISGPISQYGELVPQFQADENKSLNRDNFSQGLYRFVLGLGKKVLLADTFADWANHGYSNTSELHLFAAWGTALSYTFQLYFDFSGYSDMAVGVARMFNIRIPENFNSPFRSRNVVEFWSRWHISLGNFITAYIYTPIVRALPSVTFGYMVLASFLAMTLAGVWHGSGWTFLFYGMLHGAAIACNHITKRKKIKLPHWLAVFFTFNFVNLSFVIFRSPSMSVAWEVIQGMLGLNGVQFPKGILPKSLIRELGMSVGQLMTNDDNLNLAFICMAFYLVYKTQNTLTLEREFKPTQGRALFLAACFVFCVFGMNRLTEFVYFNF